MLTENEIVFQQQQVQKIFTEFLLQSFGTLVNSVQKAAVHLSVFQHLFQKVVHFSVFTDLYGVFNVGHCELGTPGE